MYIFAASFKLIGKRKPAIHIADIFYALTTYLYIAAATPVWSINVPTGYEVERERAAVFLA